VAAFRRGFRGIGLHRAPMANRKRAPHGHHALSERSIADSDSVHSKAGVDALSGELVSKAERLTDEPLSHPPVEVTASSVPAPHRRSENGGPLRSSSEVVASQSSGRHTVGDPGIEVVVDDRDATASDLEEAERYLVDQVLRMLGVDSGLLDASTQAVADQGMVTITIEDGEPNAAETLERLLAIDALARSSSVDRGLRGVLGGRISAWQLHRWLENRFFEVQAAMSLGNPVVWHLSTSRGSFQTLIRADRLDVKQLQALLDRTRKTIDRLVLALADAGKAGDWDQVELIEERFAEVRSFNDRIFGLLQRQWQVRGELDRAAKLAVMADLGVIPTPQGSQSDLWVRTSKGAED
jgi:hypothetical protein